MQASIDVLAQALREPYRAFTEQAERWLRTSSAWAWLQQRKAYPLAVGWSGGADSTALLLAMRALGFAVRAWHIDHAWHAHSARHAALLQRRAKDWDIPFFLHRLPPPSGKNREAMARHGRYHAWMDMAKQQHIGLLLLAHHADDQAETVCMRMLQGSGIYGCRGISETRRVDGLCILRPLLHLRKHELKQALEMADVSIIEDPSNSDLTLWRNRIRHRLFPAMRQSGHDPYILYRNWGEQARRYQQRIEARLQDIEQWRGPGWVRLRWACWSQQEPVLRAALLQRMMRALFGEGRCLGRRHLQLAEQWLAQGGHHGLDLAGCRLSHEGEALYLRNTRRLKR